MPSLTVNEIRGRLSAFSQQWKTATRENADAKLDGARGFTDSFIPGLSESQRPRYIITCDFARFRLYDLLRDVQSNHRAPPAPTTHAVKAMRDVLPFGWD